MKRKLKIILPVTIVLCIVALIAGSYIINNSKTPTPTPTVAATSTSVPTSTVTPTAEPVHPTEIPAATIAPTNAIAPTEIPTATVEPTIAVTEAPAPTAEPTKVPAVTVAPTAEPTVTVAPTATPAPIATCTPTPTVAPTATCSPTPLPTPTAKPIPTPTSTPVPTPTNTPKPTPTPAVAEGIATVYVLQAGDNVWYKLYEDGTMIVSGTGSTWDFEPFEINNARLEYAIGEKTIIIEEGITRIGDYALEYMTAATKIIIPDSLERIGDGAFYGAGAYAGKQGKTTTWVNLDFTKIKTEPQSFYLANGLENIEGSAEAMCTPTPTPTPTATPTPNPKQPRKIGVYQAESNWNNTRAEYYDNGYVYVSADGMAIINDRFFNDYYTGEPLEPYGMYFFKYVVVKEGVTKFDDEPAGATEFWLPSTMDFTTIKKGANYVEFTTFEAGDIVHGYYNGKKVTIRFKHDEVIIAQAEAEGLEYDESGYWFMPEVCEVLADMEKTLSDKEQVRAVTYRPETVESAKIYYDHEERYCYWSKAAFVVEWE